MWFTLTIINYLLSSPASSLSILWTIIILSTSYYWRNWVNHEAGGTSALVLPGAVEKDISAGHNNEVYNGAAAQQLD